jgi:beta-glucosidase-like glycosyl hydrolase/CubicO group peptidase (beta-lactamase class C family)
MRKYLLVLSVLLSLQSMAQNKQAQHWVDSVFKSLSNDQRIAQLMVVRLSSIDMRTKTVTYFDKKVAGLIKQYNVGGICVFQGGPVMQANAINALQAIAKTPILMCIDAEWGLGMRLLDSVMPLPRQMMLGAMADSSIVYQYGQIVAEQCKRFGIQVNYAPVVDINNNPNNPVINDRSFGEDKYKVALFGRKYMQGMQDLGVMACAKHFPGHGDVAVDSHLDLPVINKTLAQLDSLELYPFQEMFKAGVGSVMIAHLFIPSIDSSANRATSLSKKNVTGLLRNQLGFKGLTFTDALGMQGVNKFFPDGESAVQSLIAGNDMLCLPDDVPLAITKIKAAISKKKLSWSDIETHCKKVLMAKYMYGLSNLQPINIENLTADLNSKVPAMRRLVAENALTVLAKTDSGFFPLPAPLTPVAHRIAYVCIGTSDENAFAKRMRKDYNADVFYFNYKDDSSRAIATLAMIKDHYRKVIIGIHQYSRVPANNFGISKAAVELATQLQQQTNAITFVFGNPYAIKNWCGAKNLVACYEDDEIVQNTAIDLLQGKIKARGTLPVTVCENYKFGYGIVRSDFFLPRTAPDELGLDPLKLAVIDSIANDAIAKGAAPGCVVLVAREGQIAFEKAYGNFNYNNAEPVKTDAIYDMASVTKICATTLSIMKLYDEKKLDLKKKLGDYLPWVKGSNKENLLIEDILLHQAGLVAYIPFYKETINPNGIPYSTIYSPVKTSSYSIRVAENLFIRNDWKDTLYHRILQSPLGERGKYIYSDNDFIFLGKIVEAISGLPLEEYVQKEFYMPMGLAATGFKPRERFPASRIAPTENEKIFRQQLLRGDVHDPGAAMFGGVAGHAGLFSNAYDLAVILQMLINGGTINDKRYLNKETIELFTAYHSNTSRRGYGFDKPEKDNVTRPEAYPCLLSSPLTFGHTGFTGTCVWADPAYHLVFVFLSNRVNPDGGDNKKLLTMNVRGKIQEAVYKAMGL